MLRILIKTLLAKTKKRLCFTRQSALSVDIITEPKDIASIKDKRQLLYNNFSRRQQKNI